MRNLPNGDPVVSFSVADGQGKDKPTIWWNCQLFGKRATALQQYLKKGQAVTVSGSITEREWTDKEGNKRKTMDIRVADVALQGGKRESGAEYAPAPARAPAPTTAHAPSHGFGGMDDGDIPF
jgi:single-strand DNA-binding protein